MKLVIVVQHEENYGSENDAYWKMKGGVTYAVDNINPNHAQKIIADGIPTLSKMLEQDHPMVKDYIVDWYLTDNADEEIWASWESKHKLEWRADRQSWFEMVHRADDWFANDIKEISEEWKIDDEGNRSEYLVSYKLSDGKWYSLEEFKKLQEAVA